jgi:hypothetical protein
MNESLVRQLVWTDFRLAVLFTVFIPFALLIWAYRAKAVAIRRSLVIYWRVSSLLAITVYLMIGSLPISFMTSLAARILIPLSLWFWQDINENIETTKGAIKPVYKIWRWAMTTYKLVGTLISLTFIGCAFTPAAQLTSICKIWFEPPLAFKAIFHANSTTGTLGIYGIIGLTIYCFYLASFVLLRLPQQGRVAFRE